MTNTDSFIAEVSEEVRRDRLFALFKRYGWIGIVLVLLIVGAAGFREWNRSQHQLAAELFGDGLRTAIAESVDGELSGGFSDLDASGDRKALIAFSRSAVLAETDREEAAQILLALTQDDDVSSVYRDLASLKVIWIQANDLPVDELLKRLVPLEAPGAPFRLLAHETRAHALIREGQYNEAAAILNRIIEETAVPQDLRERIALLLTTIEDRADDEATS
ncbi:MAG: tetratricopeptide repeat protein [Rhodobacteraceae bacterium]|nr:tetratricopeptide repeat protein [Paracoccaceae bacterium]MCY4195613.1 tetratricopeptide repeat protein [Paracoccaceae bacterium]